MVVEVSWFVLESGFSGEDLFSLKVSLFNDFLKMIRLHMLMCFHTVLLTLLFCQDVDFYPAGRSITIMNLEVFMICASSQTPHLCNKCVHRANMTD